MKRLLLSIILTLSMFCAGAQDHLTYLGIPIEGTVKSFGEKLTLQGMTPTRYKRSPGTSRCKAFKGEFMGHRATTLVYHHPITRRVYEVKSRIPMNEIDSAETLLQELTILIDQQYPLAYSTDLRENGKPAHYWSIHPYGEHGEDDAIGRIVLFITEEDPLTPERQCTYYINILYTDLANE